MLRLGGRGLHAAEGKGARSPPQNHLPSHSRGLGSEPRHGEGVRSLTGPSGTPSPAHPLLPSLQLSEHTAKACGALSARDERFADCCEGKNLMQNYFCILALPPAPAPKLPEEARKPTNEQICGEEGARHAKK